MMRIAHLSDIHLDNDRAYEADTFILKALFEDLKEFHNKAPIDIVIISGDLVDKGGASFENSLEVALLTFEEKVLEPIRKNLNISKDRIFICPGNHDIDRDADEVYTERGLCQTLVCTDDVNTFCCSNKTDGIKRILKYKEFERAYHKNFANNHEITNFHSAFRLSLDSIDIGIACLNTCWRCYDSNTDKGKILLGERQLMESKRIIENCTIKIAVLHHPIDWLAEFDRKAVRNIIQRDFNLLFCGHTHDSESWTNTSFYGGLFTCIAPSNWAYNIRSNDSNLYCGYSIVDYDLKLNKITVHNRKYYHTKQKFGPNIENANNKGIVELDIPSSNQLSTIHEEIKVVGNLENIYIDTINDHLITYNTDTKAPKAIDDLFVHPNIVQTVADHEDSNPTKKEISIDEILLSDANQLVFGIKESGKTILLDKLSIELIKNNTKYKKVPVYIDYPTVRNRRFETILSRFLNIKIHSVDEFLNNHRVVLLIDNINFNDTDISNLDRLSKFVSNYPSIQIIATALQYIEGSIPVRHLSFDFYKTFETHQILGFKTKQIKELIVLWFSNSEHSVSQKYFSGIIDFFVSLNLPRTPLAVSMYLWIIEHQENYRPINHAVMLENFIERILEKLSKKEVFTDEFGYTNKLHLLAEIAYKMLILNNANYRIEYHDLFIFIHEQIKSRRFDYLAENVLNHFLNVGILVKEIEDSVTYIRFRFSCFFQFFLMKFMEYDEDFHNHVLDEENFLDFIDEIDYFTGLKRDCSDVLSKLVNRMMLEFQDIVEEIEKLPMKYDEFFREDEPIIKSLPNDFIKKLPDNKPTQRQIDRITDSVLDKIKPEKEIQKKGADLDTFERWEKLMSVASKVLKNTEETKVQDLKDSSYAKILTCSLAYSSIFKYFLEQRIKNADDSSKMHNSITSQRYIIPLINEMALFSLMGTKKLSAVIRDKIKSDLKTSNISEFEKFMSIFLYADIRANDYELYLREYVKSIKHPYIYDICLLKIVAYYYLRSNNKESDKIYLNMIADLVIKAKGSRQTIKGKTFEKFKDKSKIIQEYSNRKVDHRKQKVCDE